MRRGSPTLGKLDASVYSPAFNDPLSLERLWQILLPGDRRQAPSRIIVLAGAGVEKSRATSDLLTFAERFEIPIATTLRVLFIMLSLPKTGLTKPVALQAQKGITRRF
jgi:thiamine pyrophosphate-dependent acetolactate synthase large subunit-like protein